MVGDLRGPATLTQAPSCTPTPAARAPYGDPTALTRLVLRHRNPISIREKLFTAFVERCGEAECHSLGKCCGKYPGTRRPVAGSFNNDSLVEAYAQYKFVFALENSHVPGYITKKIVNVFRSGAIPIYWGDTHCVRQLFNKKAFIDVSDFESIEECGSHVVAMDDDTRQRMMREPIYNECELLHLLDGEGTNNTVRNAYADRIRKFLRLEEAGE